MSHVGRALQASLPRGGHSGVCSQHSAFSVPREQANVGTQCSLCKHVTSVRFKSGTFHLKAGCTPDWFELKSKIKIWRLDIGGFASLTLSARHSFTEIAAPNSRPSASSFSASPSSVLAARAALGKPQPTLLSPRAAGKGYMLGESSFLVEFYISSRFVWNSEKERGV